MCHRKRFGVVAAVFGLVAGCATPAPPLDATERRAPPPAVGAADSVAAVPSFFQNRWSAPSQPAGGTFAPTGPVVATVVAPAVDRTAPPPSATPVRPPQVALVREEPTTPPSGGSGGVTPASFERLAAPTGGGAAVWRAGDSPAP